MHFGAKNAFLRRQAGRLKKSDIPSRRIVICPNKEPRYATALLALLVNVPSGFVLNKNVFGIKHLTIPGFALFGFIRGMEAVRILFGPDHRTVANLWILLHVGTMVRLLGYFVLPYTSVDRESATGGRGDLFTEPVVYSFNILLSGYLIAAFVYPPKWLVASLVLYVMAYPIWPPKLYSRTAEISAKKLA